MPGATNGQQSTKTPPPVPPKPSSILLQKKKPTLPPRPKKINSTITKRSRGSSVSFADQTSSDLLPIKLKDLEDDDEDDDDDDHIEFENSKKNEINIYNT